MKPGSRSSVAAADDRRDGRTLSNAIAPEPHGRKESIVMIQSTTITAETEFAASRRTKEADLAWARPWLRAEGLAVFAAGLAGFLVLGLPWWAFLLLLMPRTSR